MNPYKMPLPHAAFGVAAVALSAVTLALSVYLPANLSSDAEARMLASPHVEGAEFREVNIEPSRIEVVGSCPQTMALDREHRAAPKSDQSS